MKQQGYVFGKGDLWYLRYRDSVVENGQLVLKQICKKLSAVDPEHARLRKPPQGVLDSAREELSPVNSSNLEPTKNVTVQDFVTDVYFPNMAGQKRASTLKGYEARWDSQLKVRCGHFRLSGSRHQRVTRSWLKLVG